MNHLKKVFTRLKQRNVKLNPAKCKFMKPSVYLGHLVDKEGLHPTTEKIDTIRKMKTPQNLSELRSFIGLLNYYEKFIPNMPTLLHPLYKLLQNDVEWQWNAECEDF